MRQRTEPKHKKGSRKDNEASKLSKFQGTTQKAHAKNRGVDIQNLSHFRIIRGLSLQPQSKIQEPNKLKKNGKKSWRVITLHVSHQKRRTNTQYFCSRVATKKRKIGKGNDEEKLTHFKQK